MCIQNSSNTQYEIIKEFQHDLVVDTSTQDTDEIARRIIVAMRPGLALQTSAKAIR